MKLIPIESGWMTCETDLMCEGGLASEGERMRFPVACWLIEHPKGLVLFDTGLHADLMNDSSRLGELLGSLFDVEVDMPLTQQLQKQGYSASEINVIVFSHLHFDHSGATTELPNARIIVQKAEWAAGLDPANVEAGTYFPQDFNLGHDISTIDGEYDIFGDGKVVCVPTPGHTAGHQCLRLALESGPVLLVGDCCYLNAMLHDLRLPKFSFDKELQIASMKKLIDWQAAGVKLLFGHDREQWLGINQETIT